MRGLILDPFDLSLVVNCEAVQLLSSFFLHHSWFITPEPEREVFTDQSSCCYTPTVNNEERRI